MLYSVSLANPARGRALVGCCADSGRVGNGERSPHPQVVPDTGTGISLSPGLLREHLRGQYRTRQPRQPSGCAFGRCLRQTLGAGTYYTRIPFHPVLAFYVASKGYPEHGQGRCRETIRREQGEGAAGGTGIALYRGAIYAEVNDRIMRYAWRRTRSFPQVWGEVIVSGSPDHGGSSQHPFIIDGKGNLFIDLGTATNACEAKNRVPQLAGPSTLHGEGDPWRHLALHREQNRSKVLGRGTLCQRHSQRGRLCDRRRRKDVRHANGRDPTRGRLAAVLQRTNRVGSPPPRYRSTRTGSY